MQVPHEVDGCSGPERCSPRPTPCCAGALGFRCSVRSAFFSPEGSAANKGTRAVQVRILSSCPPPTSVPPTGSPVFFRAPEFLDAFFRSLIGHRTLGRLAQCQRPRPSARGGRKPLLCRPPPAQSDSWRAGHGRGVECLSPSFRAAFGVEAPVDVTQFAYGRRLGCARVDRSSATATPTARCQIGSRRT